MLNLYRNYPFENKKVLPLIDFNIIVPKSVSRLYIKKVDSDGIYIYSDDDSISFTAKDIHYKNRTIYIFDQYEDIVGTLLTSEYIPYPIEFNVEDTLLLDSVVYRENLAGVRRVFVYKDKKYTKLKRNIVITAGQNIVINSDGTYHAYTDVLVGGYLKSINNQITAKHATIFGRNLIVVNGDEFSTTIEDPNLICPVAFKPGSIGDQGSPGDAGTDGKDGELIYDYFTNPEICDPDCACYDNPAECVNPFSEDVCSLPEVICTNCDSDDEGEGDTDGGNGCTVCDGCDSEEPEPEPEPEPIAGCDLTAYTNVETVSLIESVSPQVAPLFKLSDGVFAYDHWNPELEEEYITFNVVGLSCADPILKFSNVSTSGGFISFCCLKCLTSEDTIYVLKPSKNCEDPFSYYCDESGTPITFYSTWVTEDGALRKDLYVLYENGTTKQIIYSGSTETYYDMLYMYPDYFGMREYNHSRLDVWKNEDDLSEFITRDGSLWTLHIGIDSVYELTDGESYGEGEYLYVSGSEPEAPETIYVYKDLGPYENYITEWQAYILDPSEMTYSGPKPYYEGSLFCQSTYIRDPYYVSGEEFALICGTYTHIPNFTNSDGTSTHEFITPFEGPMKVINQGDSSIQVYDAMESKRWEEFTEWQTGWGG